MRCSNPFSYCYFIANFIKGKFGIKTEEAKITVMKEELVKIVKAIF